MRLVKKKKRENVTEGVRRVRVVKKKETKGNGSITLGGKHMFSYDTKRILKMKMCVEERDKNSTVKYAKTCKL